MIKSSAVNSAPLMFPPSLPELASKQWDYFAIVRYRSRGDLIRAIRDATRTLGPGAIGELKHSGVLETYVVPVQTSLPGHLVRTVVALLLWCFAKVFRICGC